MHNKTIIGLIESSRSRLVLSALGAVYMSRASPVSQADSYHEYLFEATKKI